MRPYGLTDRAPHIRIFWNAGAAARRDLKIGDLAAPIREIGEKALERVHALRDALAVVEPIDADDHCAAGEAFEHIANKFGFDGAARKARESFRLHADRERADLYGAISELKAVTARPRKPALVGDVAGEVRCVDLGLKPDQVVVAECGNELIVIGQGRDDFRRRKRNVNEETDLVAVPAIAQRLR